MRPGPNSYREPDPDLIRCALLTYFAVFLRVRAGFRLGADEP
jgi:hypothetical protein